ncbi:unnamed protein product [Closterium sp. NIES-54]
MPLCQLRQLDSSLCHLPPAVPPAVPAPAVPPTAPAPVTPPVAPGPAAPPAAPAPAAPPAAPKPAAPPAAPAPPVAPAPTSPPAAPVAPAPAARQQRRAYHSRSRCGTLWSTLLLLLLLLLLHLRFSPIISHPRDLLLGDRNLHLPRRPLHLIGLDN